MNFLKGLADFLSGDWWKGLAVIATFTGIVLGSVLTFGIFRLTESNFDLAASNLEEIRQQHQARVDVTAQVYIPVTDAVPQFEGDWVARLNIVNFGPASAGGAGFYVDMSASLQFAERGPLLDIDSSTIRLFDSSLNEVPNGSLATVEYDAFGFRVQVPLLGHGERLDVVAEGRPTTDLVKYAEELYSEGFLGEIYGIRQLLPPYAAVPVPANSTHSLIIDGCVFAGGRIWGENVDGGDFFIEGGASFITGEGEVLVCPR